MLSKSKIDKAAKKIIENIFCDDDEFLECDYIIDDYRKDHLIPLTETTLKLQEWLNTLGINYYIAQRLKRKPQIIKKLKRLSVRLTQLQDIGGCRIIVDDNENIELLMNYFDDRLIRSKYFTIKKITDYRIKGREDTGYRAVHIIVERNGFSLEIQVRSRLQHYWAESVERASVIYGYQLKEMEGDKQIIKYFKALSDTFYEIEIGNQPHFDQLNEIDVMRVKAEQIIQMSDKFGVYDSSINENFIKAMIAREARERSRFHNWLIVFNWNNGSFIFWQLVESNPSILIQKYSEHEKQYSAEKGYEVVVIGSSDVSAIPHTHRHYFGLESYDSILENIRQSISSATKRKEMGTDERVILSCLYKKGFWGTKNMTIDTLKNHYCKDIEDINESIKMLSMSGLIICSFKKKNLSLNIKRKADIEGFLGA